MLFFVTNSRARSRLSLARATAVSAELSWACSDAASNRKSKSPFSTAVPGLKVISTTFPGSSAATVTPWTAESDPTAVRLDCHVSTCTLAVVTIAGGGVTCLPASIICRICKNLIPARAPTTSSRPRRMRMIRLAMTR